jgi:holo-[acyl-carrier protein] synthase
MMLKRNRNSAKRLFTDKEIRYCEAKKDPYPHYAGRFAAKEAFLKSVSSGWQGTKIKWTEIEVYKDSFGKPCIDVSNLKKYKFMKKVKNVELTISQDKNYAVAVAAIGG